MKKLYLTLTIVALLATLQSPIKAKSLWQKTKDFFRAPTSAEPAPRYTTMPVADPVLIKSDPVPVEQEYEAPQVDTPLPFVSEEEIEENAWSFR